MELRSVSGPLTSSKCVTDQSNLNQALKTLDKAVEETAFFFSNLDPSDLPTLLKSYKNLDENVELLETLTKILNGIHQNLSYEVIPTAFENQGGIDSVKIAGRNFIVAIRTNASIPKDMQARGFEWLRSEAKIPELITETVNSKSLSSFVKGYFEANGKFPPEDCVKIHIQKYIQMRKA